MNCLGLEGTAWCLGAGIANDKGRILANYNHAYKPKEGGIHPREAAQHHTDKMGEVVSGALREAKLKLDDIDVIAFSIGPGLGPCLRTVATAARALSMFLDKPIVGVNHCVAHIEIGNLTSRFKDPVTLYVSGGNTQVIAYAEKKYRVFGETLDVGVGNMLDTFARGMGLPHPGGPQIEQLALKGRNYIPLPYTVKGMDVAFSGLMTDSLRKYEKIKENKELNKPEKRAPLAVLFKELAENLKEALAKRKPGVMTYNKNDLCFSLQETAFAMLCEITERAVAHTEKKEILLTGGVAQNKRLQQMIKSIADEHGCKFAVPPREFCMDNGGMIAWNGILHAQFGDFLKMEETKVIQRYRTDMVNTYWKE